MLLIPINSEGQLAENGWREIPEFAKLAKKFGDTGMKVVIMAWDSYSPYRKLSIGAREERVSKMYLGQKWEAIIKSDEYRDARLLYQELDYDALFEQQSIYNDKMREINAELRNLAFSDENSAKIKIYTTLQVETAKELGRIEEKIALRGVEKKDFVGKKMSGIEIFQERARKRGQEETVFRNKMKKVVEETPPEPESQSEDVMF